MRADFLFAYDMRFLKNLSWALKREKASLEHFQIAAQKYVAPSAQRRWCWIAAMLQSNAAYFNTIFFGALLVTIK